jgi:hypothetical protein
MTTRLRTKEEILNGAKKGRPRNDGNRFSDKDVLRLEQLAVEADPFFLIEKKRLWITTKAGQFVPLEINFTQRYILNIIKKLWKGGKPIRMLILKARQEGVSTLIEAIIYCIISTKENLSGGIVADDKDGANHLFNMSKLYYENTEGHLKPEIERSNRKELKFKDRRSVINIHTANEPNAVRKYTYRIVHLSEFCMFPYPNELMVALSQTVPELPQTLMVIETTAKGKGKKLIEGRKGNGSAYFHKEWVKAKKGETDWIPVFIPWFWDKDYQFPIYLDSEREEIKKTLDPEEKVLLETINELTGKPVTLENIKWRRYYIKNKCGGDVEKFHQEYPSTDEEAFVSGGRPRFRVPILREARKRCVESRIGDLKLVDDKIKFIPDAKGYLRIIEDPVESENYVFGADVAGGDKGEDADWSVISVLSCRTFREVAQWRGKIEPVKFGYEMSKVGKFYNYAVAGVERNNHGLTAIMALQDFKYPNIYYQQVFHTGEAKESKQIGWTTTVANKMFMCNHLEEVLTDRSLILSLEETVDELIDFGDDLESQSGWDDIVMSLAIAVEMWRAYPYLRKVKQIQDNAYVPRNFRDRYEKQKQTSRTGYG